MFLNRVYGIIGFFYKIDFGEDASLKIGEGSSNPTTTTLYDPSLSSCH
jgi:hypothetical protein